MKAALNLLQLREARVSHDAFSTDAQQRHSLVTSVDKVHATDESLDSASVEELSAMEEATRKQYDRIVSELKKRDERKSPKGNVVNSASNATAAPGTAARTPRRSGRLTTSATSEGHQEAAAANQDNPDGADADHQRDPTAQSGVQPAKTADDRAPAPPTTDKTVKSDDDCSVTQVVSNIVDAAVISVVGKDATSTTDTIAGIAANVEQKIDQDPIAQAAIDSALTPVSEANKDGDDQTSAMISNKPIMSGVETPETEPNVPDHATSPTDVMELD